MVKKIVVRAFNGSLADAEGLLAVEKATFDESPYSAEQVQTKMAGGPQRAWLALTGEEVVGFVIAFTTHGLSGPSWEIDLLAVHPDWRGRRLATRLIRAAAAHGSTLARQARAWVASDNPASLRAFTRAGFHADEMRELLIFRTDEQAPQPTSGSDVVVREADSAHQAAAWLPTGADLDGAATLLLAEEDGQASGYAELLAVETLLYRGVWIESLAASTQAVRAALIQQVVSHAVAAGLDEVGMLVPKPDRPLQVALLNAQFRSLGRFHLLSARLPLPGLARGGHD